MNELVPFEDSLFALPTVFRPFASRLAASGPRMDLTETDAAYQLAVDLPGVRKDAIQVSVHENTVTVSAELAEPKGEEGEQWLLRERSFGRFSRSITLPELVDDEASEARYVDGVLTLTLKKKSASQAKRLTIH